MNTNTEKFLQWKGVSGRMVENCYGFSSTNCIVVGGSYLGMAPGFSNVEISVYPRSIHADELRSNWIIIIETGCPMQERN